MFEKFSIIHILVCSLRAIALELCQLVKCGDEERFKVIDLHESRVLGLLGEGMNGRRMCWNLDVRQTT